VHRLQRRFPSFARAATGRHSSSRWIAPPPTSRSKCCKRGTTRSLPRSPRCARRLRPPANRRPRAGVLEESRRDVRSRPAAAARTARRGDG
jgi:hypothetical protein